MPIVDKRPIEEKAKCLQMRAAKYPVHIYSKNGVWVAARMYGGWSVWPYGKGATQRLAWDDFVSQMHVYKSPGWYHYDFARNYIDNPLRGQPSCL